MNGRPPVILLVYANDRVDPDRHLRNLSAEIGLIRDALQPAEQAGLCQILIEANATAGRVFAVFQDARYHHRIAVFHYAGHADGYRLLLESAAASSAADQGAAHAAGLAVFLGAQRGLELVFLNGCSTAPQVQGLLDAGCPAVIATSQAIDDRVATEFAGVFYQGLGGGAGLESAFKAAVAATRTTHGDSPRGLYWGGTMEPAPLDDRWPWDLSVKPGAERALHWNLPEAAGDPMFGLPGLPKLDLPDSPFRHLDWFAREHAEVFFGRALQVRDLLDRVTAPDAPPILLVYGQSGIGKSSVLAAGLLPRLETSHRIHYLRRDAQLGLLGTLIAALDPGSSAPEVAWQRAESDANAPLLVVLDQLEEVFTRPTNDEPAELATFLNGLGAIFGQPQARPRGRLILGFRKEWLPEIDECLAERHLPRDYLFLKGLDRQNIISAVSGATLSQRLRQKYRIGIDDGLAVEIADDLLADPESPIAPTLQILLTKLWSEAKRLSYDQPRFTRDLYLRLKREGILLRDFLDQQLAALEQWRPAVVESGLALDLLAFHTTPKGTAAERHEPELLETYAHIKDEFPELVQRSKDAYLLADIPNPQGAPIRGTRLAHDTLALLVRERFDESDRPGQRARRILENRAVEWRDGATGVVLDEADLGVVEIGAAGMRVISPDEVRLVAASRAEAERRQADAQHQRQELEKVRGLAEARERDRKSALEQREQAEIVAESLRLASEARLACAIEPEAALMVAWEALLWNRNELSEDVFREALDKVPAPVRRLCDFGSELGYRMTAGYFNRDRLAFAGLEDGRVFVMDLTGKPVSQFTVPGSGKLSLCAVKQLDLLFAVRDQYVRLYRSDGLQISELDLNLEKTLSDLILSCNANGICLASSQGRLWVIRVDLTESSLTLLGSFAVERTILDFYEAKGVRRNEDIDLICKEEQFALIREFDEQPWHSERVYRLAFAPSCSVIITVSFDGSARIWNTDGTLHGVLRDPAGERIDSINVLEGGKKLVTGTMHQGDGHIWTSDGALLCTFKKGKGDGDDLFIDAVNRAGDAFATTNRLNYTIDLWSSDGLLLGSFSGHTDQVRTVAFSPDSRLLVSGASDRTVRVWDCQSQRQLLELHGHAAAVISVEFSVAQQREIISTSFDGSVRIWSIEAPPLPALRSHQEAARVMSITRLGVATSSADGTTCLWDFNQEPFILPGTMEIHTNGAVHPPLTCVPTIQEPGIIRIWRLPEVNTEAPTLLSQLVDPDTNGSTFNDIRVSISTDESRFLVATDRFVNLYLISGQLCAHLIGPKDERIDDGYDQIRWAGFHPTKNLAFTAARNGMVWLWSSNGSPTGRFLADRGSPDKIFDIALDPLGEFLLICIRNHASLWTWNGELSRHLAPRGYKVFKGCFSPDGSRIVTIADNPSGSNVAEIWNRAGSRRYELHTPKEIGASSGIVFDPKNRYLCLSANESIRIYDLDGQPIGLLGAPLGITARCIAISPNGEFVASAFSDGIVRIWSLSARRRIGNLATGLARCMIFSANGRRLLVATPEGPIEQYALQIDDLFQAAAARVGREFTQEEIARFAIRQPVKLNIADYLT